MIKDIQTFIESKDLKQAFVMVYSYDHVSIGQYDNGVFKMKDDLDPSTVQEIHIFNSEVEYRGVSLDSLQLVAEHEGNYFPEEMFLIGNKCTEVDGYYEVTQYGRKMVVPFKCNVSDNTMKPRLVVHHLFSENGNYIQGYRLAGIKGVD